ncbi:hypothetical protein PV417_28225 [Streptomyces sp. ME19-03-3]|nr:hypothetical protein [Streptomyces sp. ME19-03-3]
MARRSPISLCDIVDHAILAHLTPFPHQARYAPLVLLPITRTATR